MVRLITTMAIAAIITISTIANAQQAQNDDRIVVHKSDLTKDQLDKIQARDKVETVKDTAGTVKEAASAVAGWGKEAGVAFNSFVGSLTDQTVKLSNTQVGRFAMFMIAWKVMAKDVMEMGNQIFGYLVGIPTFVFGSIALFWSYRRQCVPRRVLIEKTKDTKKYAMFMPSGQLLNPGEQADSKAEENREGWAAAHAGMAVVFFGLCSLMIFGCGSCNNVH